MIVEKIKKETIQALKSGDKAKANFLRFLYSQIKNEEIDAGRKILPDVKVISIINRQIKQTKDSLESFKLAKRKELVVKAEFELKILESYLSKQLSNLELEREVERILAQNSKLKNIGALIGIVVKTLSDKADNQRIADLVKKKVIRSSDD